MIDLNHLYVVVDLPTYQAIRDSDLVRSLACTYEQKNQAEGQLDWEGFYIRGKNTYIEFFYPQARYPKSTISGIALGTDTLGQLEDIFQLFKSKYQNAMRGNFSRNGRSWFDYVTVGDSFFQEKHSFWIMEYSKDDFNENPQDISPRHYNAERFDPSKSFLDVTEVSIALNPIGLERLSSYLQTSGLPQLDKRLYQTESGIKISLLEETSERKGIYQLRFSVSKGISPSSNSALGSSSLIITDKQATWDFESDK